MTEDHRGQGAEQLAALVERRVRVGELRLARSTLDDLRELAIAAPSSVPAFKASSVLTIVFAPS